MSVWRNGSRSATRRPSSCSASARSTADGCPSRSTNDVVLISNDVRAFHESGKQKRLSDALEREAIQRCLRHGAVKLVSDLPDLAARFLQPGDEATDRFWDLLDDQDVVVRFWDRVDFAVQGTTVPGTLLPLSAITQVLDAEVATLRGEGNVLRAFARPDDDGSLQVDFTVALECEVRVEFPAADYAAVASTAGML